MEIKIADIFGPIYTLGSPGKLYVLICHRAINKYSLRQNNICSHFS